MSKSAHTPTERAALLAAVGAPAEAEPEEFINMKEARDNGTLPGAEPKRKKKAQAPTHEGLEHDVPAIVQSIVTKAGADRNMALTLCDEFAQGVFNANKVSKIEAAQRGIESGAHNRALWTSVQTLRSALKTQIRKKYSTTIAAKVRKTSAAAQDTRDADFQAFCESDAMMTAFEAYKKERDNNNK